MRKMLYNKEWNGRFRGIAQSDPTFAQSHIRPEMTHDGMRLMVCDGLCEYLE